MVGLIVSLSLFWSHAFATEFINYSFDELGQTQTMTHFLSQVQSGDIVVVGEKHGFYPHHLNQQIVINELGDAGLEVSFGIEHIAYPNQTFVDAYIQGQLSEVDFLKQINWRPGQYSSCYDYTLNEAYNDPFSRQPFDCYKGLFWLAAIYGGSSLALNLPRTITNKIYGGGMAALSPEDLALLPPNFTEGNEKYFERFREVILSGGDAHGPISEETLKNMFTAQSLWDETMAWKSLVHMKVHPKNVLVIAVGDFHVAYGGGLPSRLLARGADKVHIISQDAIENGTADERQKRALPDLVYGARAGLTIVTDMVK